MRKQQFASLALLTFLCLFGLTIASSCAATASQQEGADVGPLRAQLCMTAVNPQSYGWNLWVENYGWLYHTVAELQRAYNFDGLYAQGYDGTGQTVAISVAYGSPTIYEDLLSFIQWQNSHGANLPWATIAEVKEHVHLIYPQGEFEFDPSDPYQLGWSTEVCLDVAAVHAFAPGADINLVISPNDSLKTMDDDLHYAIHHHLGCAISMSWGWPEAWLTQPSDIAEVYRAHRIYMEATREGITLFAATGNMGALDYADYINALFPASDPYVTGVGATNLFMACSDGYNEGTGSWTGENHTGTSYFYEIAGNDYQAMIADGYPDSFDLVTSGGAMSKFFKVPWWQHGVKLTSADGTKITPKWRCTSDVSFQGGLYGGLGLVHWSAAGSPIDFIAYGTSLATPSWAALTAIACQYAHHSLGYINPMLYMFRNFLYHAKAIHDMTLGDNTYPTGGPLLGYMATRGWDPPTGIGSPNAAKLVPLMAGW